MKKLAILSIILGISSSAYCAGTTRLVDTVLISSMNLQSNYPNDRGLYSNPNYGVSYVGISEGDEIYENQVTVSSEAVGKSNYNLFGQVKLNQGGQYGNGGFGPIVLSTTSLPNYTTTGIRRKICIQNVGNFQVIIGTATTGQVNTWTLGESTNSAIVPSLCTYSESPLYGELKETGNTGTSKINIIEFDQFNP